MYICIYNMYNIYKGGRERGEREREKERETWFILGHEKSYNIFNKKIANYYFIFLYRNQNFVRIDLLILRIY